MENKINVHSIKSNYPEIINSTPKNFIDKIKYKLSLLYLKLTVKGTIYDKGVLLEKQIKKKAIKLIEEFQIENVIVSGAPFSFLRYIVQLKNTFPKLNVICDLRDPWTNGIYYGFNNLSNKRRIVENNYESFVMLNTDIVLSPTPSITNQLIDKFGNKTNSDKFKTLYHPYDPEEVDQEISSMNNLEKLSIITGGTIDLNNIEIVFEVFLMAVDYIKSNDFQFYDNLEIKIYASTIKLKSLLNKYKCNKLTFVNKVSPIEFFSIVKQSDFTIVFLPDYVKDYFITKVNEYIGAKKPILLISNKGEVSEFIQKNKLGFWLNISQPDYPALLGYLKQHQNSIVQNDDFNPEFFSLPYITKQLVEYFK